ncbi:hypothetical protein BDK51DRAFT_51260 [Blyttiomyces helicus]|uniref:Uncharacterized protein n=1 Tax=Blyttiomyces helicus TaxID=388810 RepID=A0A4P9W8K5_9FUNG|nr:hypothetical protein BDK51DRAFT_51260 [Blyttiomyces helicus]|eukprot:RKO87130.1 hypothetical protein BDK51DRAFT_51260 [Blyttiomyces helicus]
MLPTIVLLATLAAAAVYVAAPTYGYDSYKSFPTSKNPVSLRLRFPLPTPGPTETNPCNRFADNPFYGGSARHIFEADSNRCLLLSKLPSSNTGREARMGWQRQAVGLRGRALVHCPGCKYHTLKMLPAENDEGSRVSMAMAKEDVGLDAGYCKADNTASW